MKSKFLLFSIIVSFGFVVLVIINHHTEGKIITFAKRDVSERQQGFDSLLSFCSYLSVDKSANVSFYYRSGWDSLGVEVVDTLGGETHLKVVPPQFSSQLYFNTVAVSVQYEYKQKRLIFDYPYATWNGKRARLIHQINGTVLPVNYISGSPVSVDSSW